MDLLERETELAALAKLVQATPKTACFLVIEGAPGIGKTRLLAEVRSRGEAAGITVLSARCTELERGYVYGVVRQLFEPVVLAADPATRQRLLSGAASGADALFTPQHPATDPMTDSSFAVLHGLYWLAVNLAVGKPLLLVIDDLHWADAPSLRWLAYLLPRMEGTPLRVVVALRPNEPDADQTLLSRIVLDPLGTSVQPASLSASAAGRFLTEELGGDVDPTFTAVCHYETGGNPLLLRQLVNTIIAEKVTPTAANAARLRDLGANAVARTVSRRLAALPAEAVRLATAVAVLGDDADLHEAAAMAGMPIEPAAVAARTLAKAGIVYDDQPLRFVHPLVRASVYAQLGSYERRMRHSRAAKVLAEAHAEPERIAAQLLLVPQVGEDWAVKALRIASSDALARGAPDIAFAYLRRCLEELPDGDERLTVLIELGTVARSIDLAAGAEYLEQALARTDDPMRRGQIALLLSDALVFLMRTDEAIDIISEAIIRLPQPEVDLRRRLEAQLLIIPLVGLSPRAQQLLEQLPGLRDLPAHDSAGARALDCAIALHDTFRGDPTAVRRAQRALSDHVFITQANMEAPKSMGWLAALAGDSDDVMNSLDVAVAQAHSRGSPKELAYAYSFRSLGWLWRGQLAEAESDAKEGLQLTSLTSIQAFRPFTASSLAHTLIEQGRLSEAETMLDGLATPDPLPPAGAFGWYLEARAALLRRQGRLEHALSTALRAGERFAVHGQCIAPLVAWQSEAALSCLALGRRQEAHNHAQEQLRIARQWSAPRTLGRALRIAALVSGGPDGLALLTEAVSILADSPARLEHAKALVELGSAVRRSGHRAAAKDHLLQGLDLAHRCGAAPLAQQATDELRIVGARPRRAAVSGPQSLTPSETRVAELAAQGLSNREIAQQLFVTVKTVEVHLGNTYRKLDITRRDQLHRHLPVPKPAEPKTATTLRAPHR